MVHDKFRDEIVESQRVQHDLTKWKLISVAAIGAAGLGLLPGKEPAVQTGALIVLIPLVCLYVDALSYHTIIRVLMLARYFRQHHPRVGSDDDFLKRYEDYCLENRSHFSVESYASLGSTALLSIAVALFGMFKSIRTATAPTIAVGHGVSLLLQGGGLAAFVGSVLMFRAYQREIMWLDREEEAAKRRWWYYLGIGPAPKKAVKSERTVIKEDTELLYVRMTPDAALLELNDVGDITRLGAEVLYVAKRHPEPPRIVFDVIPPERLVIKKDAPA